MPRLTTEPAGPIYRATDPILSDLAQELERRTRNTMTMLSQGEAYTKGQLWVAEDPGTLVTLDVGPEGHLLVSVSGTPAYTNILTADLTFLGDLTIDSWAEGSMGYTDASSVLTELPIGAAGQVLGVSGVIPAWQTPSTYLAHALLSATHNDTVPAAATIGDLVAANGSAMWAALPVGVPGAPLVVNPAGLPAWVAPGPAAGQLLHFQSPETVFTTTLTYTDTTRTLAFTGGSSVINGSDLASATLTIRGSTNGNLGYVDVASPLRNTANPILGANVALDKNVHEWRPTIGSTGASLLSVMRNSATITVDNGVFIYGAIYEQAAVTFTVSPAFAVFTLFLAQTDLISSTSTVAPVQAFCISDQIQHTADGSGNITTPVPNHFGLGFSPRLRTTTAGDRITVTNTTAVQVAPTFSTAAGTFVTWTTIRGLHMRNPAVGLFQPSGGTEAMGAYIGVDVDAIPFGGTVTKVALRSSLVSATNTWLIQNLGTADSTFNSRHLFDVGIVQHLGDGIIFSSSYGAAGGDMLIYWDGSDFIFNPLATTDNMVLDIAAGSVTLSSSAFGSGSEFRLGYERFAFGQTTSVGNQVGIFVAAARTVGLAGEWADFLLSQAANLDLDGNAMGNVFGWKINAPGITLSGGSVTDGGALIVSGNVNQGTNRYGVWIQSNPSGGTLNYSLRTAGDTRVDGDFHMAGATSGLLTFTVPAITTNHTLTWPANTGAAGAVLTDAAGSGVLSWAVPTAPAPVGAAYVTIGNDATLTDERALTGTANQITVTDNGAGSTVVLSTPQDIHTGASPTFVGLTLSGASLTINTLAYTWPGSLGAAGAVLTDVAGNGTVTWVVPSAGGAQISPTPANNEIAVWTNTTTIEGDPNFTWTGTTFIARTDSNFRGQMRWAANTGILDFSSTIRTRQFEIDLDYDGAIPTVSNTFRIFGSTNNWFVTTIGSPVTQIEPGGFLHILPKGDNGVTLGDNWIRVFPDDKFLRSTTGHLAYIDMTNEQNSAGAEFVQFTSGTAFAYGFGVGMEFHVNIDTQFQAGGGFYAYGANVDHAVGSQEVGFLQFLDTDVVVYRVDLLGDVKIRNVDYIWPAANGAATSVLTDVAGNGTLTWEVPAAGVTGTGAVTQVVRWTGASTVTGDAELTYTSGTEDVLVVGANGAGLTNVVRAGNVGNMVFSGFNPSAGNVDGGNVALAGAAPAGTGNGGGVTIGSASGIVAMGGAGGPIIVSLGSGDGAGLDGTVRFTLVSLKSTGIDIEFFHGTTSTGNDDEVTVFSFISLDDTGSPLEVIYAEQRIEITTVTAASEDGRMMFSVMDGGSLTEMLRMDSGELSFFAGTPAPQAAAYTRNATIVEDRTLLQSSAATAINNNNVLAALIADLQSYSLIQ